MLLFSIQASGGTPGFGSQLPFLAIMIAIIYFFFIRPQSKKQKQQNEFLTSLEKGKEVVTNSGIIGRISKISDNEVSLQVSEKNYIRVTLGSISRELTEAYFNTETK